MEKERLNQLKCLSYQIRIDILKMIECYGQGHVGGSLSIVELLTVLYGKQMNYNQKDPHDQTRDQLILSKGHAGPALYSTLANVGFFDRSLLQTLNQGGTLLPSHPDRMKTPGVDMTTGSLGQGTSVAAGLTLALKRQQLPSYVYLIVGDGELNEGQCWEAFQFIAHYKLNHCIVIIDENKRQLDGYTKDVMNGFDYVAKMEAFGFYTKRVKGNDLALIDQAIDEVKSIEDQAVCIVLDTIKGQGVPYFESMEANHSVKFSEEVKIKSQEAISQFEAKIKELNEQ